MMGNGVGAGKVAASVGAGLGAMSVGPGATVDTLTLSVAWLTGVGAGGVVLAQAERRKKRMKAEG